MLAPTGVPSPQDGAGDKEAARSKVNVSKTLDPSSNPFSQLGLKANGKSPGINIGSNLGRPITPIKRPISASGKSSPKPGELLETWENRVLGSIFRLTLDPGAKQDSHGHHLQFVAGVRSDLEDRHESVILSTAVLEQALFEAASSLEKMTPLDYLLACWKRVVRQMRTFKGATSLDPKFIVLKEARRLCMSYCLFAVTMPDMFG